jgi:hypothetical protein
MTFKDDMALYVQNKTHYGFPENGGDFESVAGLNPGIIRLLAGWVQTKSYFRLS